MTSARWRLLAASAAVTLLASGSKLAAQGTVTGRVTAAEGAHQPIAEARIIVIGANATAVTNEDGKYTLRGVREGNVELQVLRVGFKPVKKMATIANNSTTNVDFEMTVSVVQLDEIVTTATGQQRRIELGNAGVDAGQRHEVGRGEADS
jgi:hypothetical protein